MVKPLTFKGDKKYSKKRKAPTTEAESFPPKLEKAVILAEEADRLNEDDSWVTAEVPTDIVGPIVFALPSIPPTCIACDANGKIFTSELENMVDGNAATAEPHDVRQVWVASRVSGTDNISFKGHHQRYLSCDYIGNLSAINEAISPEESFLCLPSPETPGTFNIQTAREKYLTVAETSRGTEIRGDAEEISFNSALRIRMQARFKPRLKANKESKAKEKVSRRELEDVVGRRLEDAEVKRLKKARVQGDYHEAILDVRVKGKHDKYS
ncbi:MAG: hypothetical protein HETSPECPRED_009866 [Heterodermia speciosa]|uniref:Actin-crosslinking protein n=1 Tax=Heterodermia speciosa TaxID=116794 RepID=A0A8H3G9S9_9LECA|nr:MAG: hypothetical protein HETSPECPRED_009866 [Heterodermia speciosa]